MEALASLIPNFKVEVMDPLLVKGAPKEDDFKALDKLAENIAENTG